MSPYNPFIINSAAFHFNLQTSHSLWQLHWSKIFSMPISLYLLLSYTNIHASNFLYIDRRIIPKIHAFYSIQIYNSDSYMLLLSQYVNRTLFTQLFLLALMQLQVFYKYIYLHFFSTPYWDILLYLGYHLWH